MSDYSPEFLSYGGVERRVTITVDTYEALEAGRRALELFRLALADFTVDEVFVDEITREVPIDPSWQATAQRD